MQDTDWISGDLREAQQVLADFIAAGGEKPIAAAIELMAASLRAGGHIYSAGNGGSMCDAQHFAEELTGRYRLERASLGAQAICDPSHLTCVGNDYGFEAVFARYLRGMGRAGDVFLGISTSGNSRNIIAACEACEELGLKRVLLLGKDGGALKARGDVVIIVPHHGFADRIQEVHTLIIHIMIRGLERALTGAS